jgi:putative hydrolase of the HAD superfamily
MRKPDPAIYELAAQRLGMHPSDCVFVDDLQVNLETATKLGMATVLHEDAAQTIGQLRNIFADYDLAPAGA